MAKFFGRDGDHGRVTPDNPGMTKPAPRRTSLPRCSLLALALALPLGCADDSDGGDDGGSSGDGSQWQVTYEGALSGEAGGSIVAVVAAGMSVAIAASGGLDTPELSMTVSLPKNETGEAMVLPFTLRFADDTSCVLFEAPVMATVSDGDPDTYAVDFTGRLECDAGTIDIEGFVRAG